MADSWVWSTVTSSLLLRLCGYIFFRWIPGDLLPSLIISFAVVHIICFFKIALRSSPYEILADDVTVVTKDVDLAEIDCSTGDLAGPSQLAKELDAQETVILQEKPSHPIVTLLTGLPSPSSLLWSAATLLLNIMIVCGTLDMTFRSAWYHPEHELAFARLGYVSDTTAKIFLREPDVQQLPVFLSYRYADTPQQSIAGSQLDSAWKHGDKVERLSQYDDYTAILVIHHLEPDTRYQWVLSNNHTGYLITAPRPGEFSMRSTRTSPSSPSTKSFTFLHSSCIIPHFPYNPFDHPLHIPGLKYLSQTLSSLKPAFFLFLGDFIYIDVPHRHGTDEETYRRHYRQAYASPDWPTASHVKPLADLASYDSYNLPWLHVWDDHEISNDWSHNTSFPYSSAVDAYQHYHMAANPPLYPKRSDDTTYYTFVQGPASFFVADTRRYRSEPNTPNSTMLGAQQLRDVLAWLAAPEPAGVRWKMLVSSVPFTRNWRINGADTWGGYLQERRVLLDAMWTVNGAKALAQRAGLGVVVLSGDRHEHATTAFSPPPSDARFGPESTVHEFSTSPLNMFYLPVRSYREDTAAAAGGERDVCVHYEPEGNSKFGAVSIEESTGSGQSVLRYRLFVDGVQTWSHVLVAPEQRAGTVGRERWRDGVWA